MTVPVPFELVEQSGHRVATNGAQSLMLMEPDGRLFRRRGIKGVTGPDPQPVEWAVAELDGVRVYFDGVAVIVTRADLNP